MVSGGTTARLLAAMEFGAKKESTRETQRVRTDKFLKAIGFLKEGMFRKLPSYRIWMSGNEVYVFRCLLYRHKT